MKVQMNMLTYYIEGHRDFDDKSSDADLLKSLSIKPEDPYVLNYLGYSWLERGYKIQKAISMLDKVYDQKK